MKDSIVMEREDGTTEIFNGGKDFVDAVANAASKEELRDILKAAGISGFREDELDESYRNLALSQNWNAIQEMFEDTDFESCKKKLETHGIETSKENFDLVNEVIASASDDELLKELLVQKEIEGTMKVLHAHGYHALSAEFLLTVRENAKHLRDDALLTAEEIEALSGKDFYERCKKSINLMFALSTVAGLALGVSGITEPAYLIALAGGISLMFRKE